MKTVRALLVPVVAVAVAATAVYGVGHATRDRAEAAAPPIVRAERPVPAPADPVPDRQPTVGAPTVEPAPLLEPGDQGPEVRELQARLAQIAWYFGDNTATYDAATVEAVRGFQAKREIAVTGEVDEETMARLLDMTSEPTYEELHDIAPEPGALDPRCTTGRVMCVDKSTSSLRWVVDGVVLATFDARFGSSELPTREGEFSVSSMSRDHVSSLYDTPMPYAMFFSGGQAVHYSPDFAATGYAGASHGCVNIRDLEGISWLFDQVQVGDSVVVYWS